MSGTLHRMPAHTEDKIHQLCTEALASKTQGDVERVVAELRAALEEHINLAKESLGGQITGIAAMEVLAQKGETHLAEFAEKRKMA